MNRPTEQELRQHFGKLLKPDAVVETIKYTAIWAADDGTLLWDPKNGYADLTPKQRVIIYMTGPPASGKTTLVELMHNAVELNAGAFINFTDLSRALKRVEDVETAVITYNSPDIKNLLRIWCREHNLKFYHINLTRTQHEHV